MIILLGFPKSGTTSFNKLFQKLGYKSGHWKHRGSYIGNIIKKNKKRKRRLLSGLEDLDCITQMDVCMSKKDNYWPQIHDYWRLYKQYPKATFILNKRSIPKLVSSFQRWFNLDERFIKYNPNLFSNIEGSNEKKLEIIFNDHYTKIENFFKKRKGAKFISFDIDNDKIYKLNKYINTRRIKKLPHKNKNKRRIKISA